MYANTCMHREGQWTLDWIHKVHVRFCPITRLPLALNSPVSIYTWEERSVMRAEFLPPPQKKCNNPRQVVSLTSVS